ncbi:MAG: exostosin family protein [Cyanobacteriota bacterium]|nr:exostosin family protein [Cyanobacteriota bacterium]
MKLLKHSAIAHLPQPDLHGENVREALEKIRFQFPLELWYKKEFVLPNCRPAPLLMHASPDDEVPELQYWNLLREKLRQRVKFYPFDDLSEAGEIVVTPNHLRDYGLQEKRRALQAFNRDVVTSGKTLITFAIGQLIVEHLTFRDRGKVCIPSPLWLYDLKSQIQPLEKPKIPTLSFVGNVSYPGLLSASLGKIPLPLRILNKIASHRDFETQLSLRLRRTIARQVRQTTLRSIRQQQGLKMAIIERDRGFFSASEREKAAWKKEYIESLNQNAYHLCIRGDSNTCFQIYEILSAGRIPVIIDTDIELPSLGTFGRWDEFSIRVPLTQLSHLGERVRAFHQRLSDEAFKQTCAKARAAYEYLLPHNFIFSALEKY